MRILFLSRRSPPVRLGYVTENELTERDWENAVQGLGNLRFTITRNSGTQILYQMRLFDSPCQPGIYLPRKMKVEPYLSLERD